MSDRLLLRWFKPQDLREYIIQVSLIILSILIATGISHCEQDRQEDKRLQEYWQAIQAEVEEEIRVLENNVFDAQKDVKNLKRGITLAQYAHPDSTLLSLQEFARTNLRGVFRTFPPSTYETMVSTGDVHLIKDLEFRNTLGSAFNYLQEVVKPDLINWDAATQKSFEQLSPYLNVSQLLAYNITPAVLANWQGFQEASAEVYAVLLRQANIRAFHLSAGLSYFQNLQEELSTYTLGSQPGS
ncbi:MAG: hypothetical protein AAF433_06745 [Bacteroidota bacterium]